ncbi:MAG: hypothetical protein GZ085_11620 [Sulfuriferula multivorans]|uniref:Uncharacterized protein n=1 Tax=Sulfuriferula multivorans TaxID=1559896 RepID=A0A7C9TDC2_9PROT|nr:hypothetical protein [Sulfuriferula multivorans]
MMRIGQQIRTNLVALISLLVALSALGYTAWRQELTEDNRTLRVAAFSMLQTAEELQSVVDFAHYDADLKAGNPIKGWGKVLYIRDLGTIMPPPVQKQARDLQRTWEQDWNVMEHDEAAAMRITQAIERLRAEVRVLLVSLQ